VDRAEYRYNGMNRMTYSEVWERHSRFFRRIRAAPRAKLGDFEGGEVWLSGGVGAKRGANARLTHFPYPVLYCPPFKSRLYRVVSG
jgi:hypothetical protein